jgi:hypothetical protein
MKGQTMDLSKLSLDAVNILWGAGQISRKDVVEYVKLWNDGPHLSIARVGWDYIYQIDFYNIG